MHIGVCRVLLKALRQENSIHVSAGAKSSVGKRQVTLDSAELLAPCGADVYGVVLNSAAIAEMGIDCSSGTLSLGKSQNQAGAAPYLLDL